MDKIDTSLRQTTLTILVALLIITAGCTSEAGGDLLGSETAEENTESDREKKLTPGFGEDLRSVSFDQQFGYVETGGELDGSDPQQNNTVYEPVEFLGQESRYYNITMDANPDSEEMRLIDPDGEVVAVTTGNITSPAKFELLQLNKTGKYTIEASSVEERDTFEYSLTINEVKYAGPHEEWSEYERYSQFAYNTQFYWNQYHLISEATYDVGNINTTDNYVVVEYERNVDANETVRQTDRANMGRTVIDAYQFQRNPELGDRENPAEWYPDRIYFKGYSEDGELVQTNYVSIQWTDEYLSETTKGDRDFKDTKKYSLRIAGTTKYGPAHSEYLTADSEQKVTEATFPYPTYNESYVDFPTA